MRSAALCLILVLSTVVHRGLGASVKGQYELMNTEDHLDTLQEEESHMPVTLFRTKRSSALGMCTYCCGCCRQKKCAWCCIT